MESLSNEQKKSFARDIEQLMTILERQHADFNEERKKMESMFQVECPSSLPQNDVIQCTEKV